MPETVIAPITGLSASTDYTVKVYPVNAWAKVGAPIVTSFTTTSSDIAPDILDVEFNLDGSATDKISGESLGTVGTVTTVYDELLGTNVASFNGSSGYRYDDIGYWYNATSYGLTIEAYVKITGTTGSTMSIASNIESGGFGLSCSSNTKKLTYSHYIQKAEDSYNNVSSVKEYDGSITGQWLHIVAVFTGKNSRLYVNGVLVASKTGQESNGILRMPPKASRVFYIGGDVNSSGGFTDGAKMQMTSFKMYSRALSDANVSTLYGAYANN